VLVQRELVAADLRAARAAQVGRLGVLAHQMSANVVEPGTNVAKFLAPVFPTAGLLCRPG
jgi:hypothetical protein